MLNPPIQLFAATSDEEMTMWVKGLNWLLADTLKSSTPLQIERYWAKTAAKVQTVKQLLIENLLPLMFLTVRSLDPHLLGGYANSSMQLIATGKTGKQSIVFLAVLLSCFFFF